MKCMCTGGGGGGTFCANLQALFRASSHHFFLMKNYILVFTDCNEKR